MGSCQFGYIDAIHGIGRTLDGLDYVGNWSVHKPAIIIGETNMESTSEEVPLSQISLSAIHFNGKQLPFNDQQLLDFYEHALARDFQQVRMILIVGLTLRSDQIMGLRSIVLKNA